MANSLSLAATPVATLMAWNTASIGPSPMNEPVPAPPSGSVTETLACGERSDEASTSNQSSV